MISVIIPSYNREKTIKKSIDSVLNQTITDLEVIVVDDGSTDNTENKVKSIRDSRLRYIKLKRNCGACVARNRGIKESKGNYIAFQDSDDIWAIDKLEKQLSLMIATNADMVYCGMHRYVNNKKKYYPSDQKPGEELTLRALLSKNKISTQSILIKKDVAEITMFDPTFKRLQDWDFSIRVLLGGYNIKYLAEPLIDAVVQNDSITVNICAESSYLHFVKKYKCYYEMYPDSLSEVYYTVGVNLIGNDKNKARRYFMKSLKVKFGLKPLLRLISLSIN